MAQILSPEILEHLREREWERGGGFYDINDSRFITTCRATLLLFIEHILKRAWEELHYGVHNAFLLLLFIAAADRDCFLGTGQTAF